MSKGAGWKATERRIACQIGGVRNGNRGMATADCENSWLCCEVKHWSPLPVRVVHAMEQAEHADGDGHHSRTFSATRRRRGKGER